MVVDLRSLPNFGAVVAHQSHREDLLPRLSFGQDQASIKIRVYVQVLFFTDLSIIHCHPFSLNYRQVIEHNLISILILTHWSIYFLVLLQQVFHASHSIDTHNFPIQATEQQIKRSNSNFINIYKYNIHVAATILRNSILIRQIDTTFADG